MALVPAVVTRSPFWSNQVPSRGTLSIPSCAIPTRAKLLANPVVLVMAAEAGAALAPKDAREAIAAAGAYAVAIAVPVAAAKAADEAAAASPMAALTAICKPTFTSMCNRSSAMPSAKSLKLNSPVLTKPTSSSSRLPRALLVTSYIWDDRSRA
ncbi:hypothetical protein D3C75_1063290 [compost metagenome]